MPISWVLWDGFWFWNQFWIQWIILFHLSTYKYVLTLKIRKLVFWGGDPPTRRKNRRVGDLRTWTYPKILCFYLIIHPMAHFRGVPEQIITKKENCIPPYRYIDQFIIKNITFSESTIFFSSIDTKINLHDSSLDFLSVIIWPKLASWNGLPVVPWLSQRTGTRAKMATGVTKEYKNLFYCFKNSYLINYKS